MLPKCCGKIMKIVNDGIKFSEVICEKCGDVVYVKKSVEGLPQLIDD